MIPLDISQIGKFVITRKEDDQSTFWHLYHRHVYLKGLKLLRNRNIVSNLPHIADFKLCRTFVYGNEEIISFLARKTWKASTRSC